MLVPMLTGDDDYAAPSTNLDFWIELDWTQARFKSQIFDHQTKVKPRELQLQNCLFFTPSLDLQSITKITYVVNFFVPP